MVRIRLRRVGRKKQPSYRIVVADARSPRDGRYIEVIGFYNPRTQPATMTIKEDRALYWLSNGAQPSDPVRRILDKLGTLARYERLRQGEAVEALVAEAEAQYAAAGTPSTRTAYAPHEIQRPKPAPQPVAPKAESKPAAKPQPALEPEEVAETEEAVEAEALADVEQGATPEAVTETQEQADTESLPAADSDAKPEVAEVGETEDDEPPADA